MEYIVDIVIIAIIVISVIAGCSRGLVKTVFGCFGVIAALACAFFLAQPAGEFIKGTAVYGKMSLRVVEIVDGYLDGGAQSAQAQLDEFMNSDLSGTLTRLGFDIESAADTYVEKLDEAGNGFAVYITDKVLSFLATALGALAVFLLSLILIKLLGFILECIVKLPVLKTVNRVGGGIAGAVSGIITVYIFCMALEIILPYIPDNPVIYMGMAENTFIYRYFASFNPATLILAAIGMGK